VSTLPISTPVLEARALSRSYEISRGPFRKAGEVRAVQEVSFKLAAGSTLAVVGESGCGKSTLARMVAMIDDPTAGDLIIDGLPVDSDERRRALRSTVQMVFQNPYGSLNPRQKVGGILEEPLKINRPEMGREQRHEAARAMMARVGLRPEHYERYPHMFSGGQRQRIAIARSLMLNPKILVLDEPVSALDLSIQAQVLNILMDLQAEFGLAYLFISHDLSVVKHVADEVAVMYLGRIVEQAPRDALFARPRHPYTRALLAATPVADPSLRKERVQLFGELPSPLRPPSGCAFHPRCPYVDDRGRRELPRLLPNNTGGLTACHGVQEGRL
jgi:dipeptide transport system ATP-binding protein